MDLVITRDGIRRVTKKMAESVSRSQVSRLAADPKLQVPISKLRRESLEEIVDSFFAQMHMRTKAADCVLFIRPAKSVRRSDYITVIPSARSFYR